MNETVFDDKYFGKARFQSGAEARRRRIEQGKSGQRLTRWTIAQTKSLLETGPVLDLACGNGRHLRALATGGVRVLGCDISEPMLKSARSLVTTSGHFPLLRLEAENLPFADGSFDVTYSARFFHHLPNRRIRERILSEAFRVSRKGIVITYKARFTYEHLKSYVRKLLHGTRKGEGRQFIGKSEISDIARSCGWRISREYSAYGCLSANRALVLEPGEERWTDGKGPF
jgi:ubiquinone/menaquinone biosynthesis C-methylase UbiE